MLRYILSLLVAALAALLYTPISRNVTVLGFSRGPLTSPVRAQGEGFYRIEDTMQCEDLHYHAPWGKIFAACEDSILPRFKWFPPLETLEGDAQTTGSIHLIDPKSMKSTRLQFENFPGPFITHGFDIVADPAHPNNAVYILAVNHLSNPAYSPDSDLPKARSQIELFHHVLGTSTARFVRSIRHPLITTPNDIYAVSPNSFYVTNDHSHRGGLLRHVGDFVPYIGWSSTVHVQLDSLAAKDAEDEVTAHTALTGLKNNNGLGHGATPDEILVTSAIGGVLYRASASSANHTLTVEETIPVDSTIDNPSYYRDLKATPGNDASGYVLAGLRRAADLPGSSHDPKGKESVVVWLVRKNASTDAWEQRVLFEDDGTNIRSASAAVLVPAEEGGSGKKAWLFVSGFYSESVVAVEVDL